MVRLMGWIMLLLLLLPLPGMQAQEVTWEDGCDPLAAESLEGVAALVDYGVACETYRTCDTTNGDGDLYCQLEAMQVMTASCADYDDVCLKTVILYAAAILAYDMPMGEALGWSPPQTVIDGVPQGLAAFQAGDYAGALAAYQMTAPEDYVGDTNQPLSRAIIYEMLGQPDEALREYQTVFSFAFAHPLAWVARANLYGSLGRLNEAAFDIEALAQNTVDRPALHPLVEVLQARYPLDETRMSDWVLYALTSQSDGPGGSFILDETLKPPLPVRLGWFDDPPVLLGIGLSNWSVGEGPNPRQVLILPRTDTGVHTAIYPSYYENAGSLSLTPGDGGLYEGQESIGFFEGASKWSFLLMPVGAPDPRAGLESQRLCPGSVVSRLRVGDWVNSAYHGDDLGMTFQPAQVIDGPDCRGSETWWQVMSGETVLWIAENEANQYRLNPSDAPETIFTCAGAPARRINVGTVARVVTGLGANNLRAEPGVDSALIGQLPEGAAVVVAGGPVCADGMVWWQVRYEETTGYTSEGQGSTYWLEPAQ